MLPHLRNVARAEVAEAGVVRLVLMRFERTEKCLVLQDGVIDLALKKFNPALHLRTPACSVLWFPRLLLDGSRRGVAIIAPRSVVEMPVRLRCVRLGGNATISLQE